MRLLELTLNGEFKLTRDLLGDRIPSYAILSHTWGPDTEEVTLKDMVDDTAKGKVGYNKIKFCAEIAGRDGLRYFWVDTCCIDKSNNNELSEAINSMFRWYRDATRCYVYLSDVSTTSSPQNNDQTELSWAPLFRASRWFTRGWTLQELIAPASVEFFTREGVRLGDKISLGQQIHNITGIPVSVLQGAPLSQFEVDKRIAWATTRQTTREEDWAYCLLGICGVFMPLIYGEGREHAIGRLKREINNTPNGQGMSDSSAIHDWLEAPDASIEYRNACKKRHLATGLWLVERPSFSSWLQNSNSLLWLNGFAGCGKSVICSTAIQYVSRHQKSSPRVGVAFFFFVFDDQSKQDTSAMLRALILQLSSQLEDNHTVLSRLHNSYRNTTLPNNALADCLHQLIRKFDHTYILLDALDESPQDKHREDVLQALVELRAWSEPGLHLLVTSRNEPNIRDVLHHELGALENEIISMKNKSVDGDIAAFTAQHLRDNRKLRKWAAYYDQIEVKFSERAKGVFRWVECQFKALEQCPQSKHLLDQLLDSLPESLDQTYERMLLNIAPTFVEYSKSMLRLLCCAKRPLTVPELVDGVAVELGNSPKFNPSRRLETVDAIHEVCPGFIETDEQASGVATVRIAHFSVQEYLESERIIHRAAAKFSVRKREAHIDIACICLTYLLEPALLTSINREKEYPLAFYAAKTWHEHLCEGDERVHPVQHQTFRLFQNTARFENWVAIWNVDNYYGQKPAGKVPSPVYYASLLGLDLVLSGLLGGNTASVPLLGLSVAEVSRLVNTEGGEYGTALQAASARGYERGVRLLLEKNADINACGGYYGNALQAASAEGHEKTVHLLLARNANVNAHGGEYGNALYAASARGHESIVRLLLRMNVDVNAQGGEYRNALYAASAGGYEAIVQQLLERNADINALSGGYGNALYAASARGHESVVRLLLGRNADVNVQGGEYGSALHAASARGYEVIVRLLLERNANINVQGGYYGDVLQAALAGGHANVYHILLEKRATVNTIGSTDGREGEPPRTQLQSARISESPDKIQVSFRQKAKKKSGRGTGAVGLTNLGNTGYMSSPLQCLRSVKELTKYFLTGEYADDINTQNPLGYSGEIAMAYCNLLNEIYHTSNDSVQPSDFRSTMGTYCLSFSGQGQQDSQEFVGFLLDALLEDLCRVKRKPYIERPNSTDDMVHDKAAIAKMADETWDIEMKRKDSVIMDLFTGQYKVTLTCPICDKIDINFDSFNNLTIRLPDNWAHTVNFVSLNYSPVKIEVEMLEDSTIGDLKQFISSRTSVPVERLIVAEQFKGKFYQIYQDIADVLEIRNNDNITIHELEVTPSHPVFQAKHQLDSPLTSGLKPSKSKQHLIKNICHDYIVIPVLHRRGNKQIRTFNDNGLPPHFIVLNREEARSEDTIRRKILERIATFTTRSAFQDGDEDTAEINIALYADSGVDSRLQNTFDLGYFSDVNPSDLGISTGWKIKPHETFPHLSDRGDWQNGGGSDENAGPIVRLGEGIVVDWTNSAWDMLFGMDSPGDPNRGAKTYLNPFKLHDPVLEQQRISRQITDISLDDCLDEFERSKTLREMDAWYCPRCKKHVRASCKFEVWKTPDILIFHLKRASSKAREKIDSMVTFPVEGLDLEQHVLKKEVGKTEVYDLISVVEHFGGYTGGHYTASAKNFIDGTWYHYDDSIVEVIKDPNDVVKGAAYILFYRRRSERPLGGPRYSHTSKAYP